MQNKKIIIANWKQNPENLNIAEKLLNTSLNFHNHIIFHAVPDIFLGFLQEKFQKEVGNKELNLILQNISEFSGGSHTGEISASQAKNLNIGMSIIGHSETRLSPQNPHGDEDKNINLKLINLFKENLLAVLCVGEYERLDILNKPLNYKEFIKNQLDNCLEGIGKENFDKLIIAYEPIWAIGKNAQRAATNEEILEVIEFIKKYFKENYGLENIKILYGGSVDENNVAEILGLKNVDGLLVGRASSDPEKWRKLLTNINSKDENSQQVNHLKNLKIKTGDKVLLRLDLNVPTNNEGGVLDDFRIQESLATIKYLQNLNAKIIILAHKESGSLEKISEYMKNNFEILKKVKFIKSITGQDVLDNVENLQNGEILLLENLRLNEGEKKNDEEFAKFFTNFSDFYVNEAFSASHRKHASIVGIPKILDKEKCALGINFSKEIENLSLALTPKHPSLLIVGGAKFDTKLPMLEKFLGISDNIFVGGALAHSFWQNKKYNLGKSLLDDEVKLSEKILLAEEKGKIILPIDVEVENKQIKLPNEINSEEKIMDFGPETLNDILDFAKVANTIVWNGPVGFYEGGYDFGTKGLIEGLNNLQNEDKNKIIILGGGDTVTEINKSKKENTNINYNFTHISTGGGAMIDFLSNGTLPGIEVLK